jgi:hypothetical protein
VKVEVVYCVILSVLIEFKVNIVYCFCGICEVLLVAVQLINWNRPQSLRICHSSTGSSVDVQGTCAALHFNDSVCC